MEIIRHRNTLDLWLYLIIFFGYGFFIILPLRDKQILFLADVAGLSFLILFLHFRELKISVDKNFISVDFTFLNIPYKRIRREFDNALVSKYDSGSVFFNNGDKIILSFTYDEDTTDSVIENGILKINYRRKSILIGNAKTSYKLFNEIRQTTLKQAKLSEPKHDVSA